MAACSGAVHSFCLLSSLLPTAYLKDGMKFNCTLCAALSCSACPSKHGAHHCDKTYQMLTQLPATAYPMPCHTMPCHPVLSHPIPSHPESTFSASPRYMAMQEGFIDTKFVSLPQRRRNSPSAPLCTELGLLLWEPISCQLGCRPHIICPSLWEAVGIILGGCVNHHK